MPSSPGWPSYWSRCERAGGRAGPGWRGGGVGGRLSVGVGGGRGAGEGREGSGVGRGGGRGVPQDSHHCGGGDGRWAPGGDGRGGPGRRGALKSRVGVWGAGRPRSSRVAKRGVPSRTLEDARCVVLEREFGALSLEWGGTFYSTHRRAEKGRCWGGPGRAFSPRCCELRFRRQGGFGHGRGL